MDENRAECSLVDPGVLTLGPMTYYLPIPRTDPESILKRELSDFERRLVSLEISLAYGDTDGIGEFYDSVPKGSRYFLTVAGAIVCGCVLAGDTVLFDRVRADLIRFGEICEHPHASIGSMIMEYWIREHLHVSDGYPDWLLKMELEGIPINWRRQVLFLVAHVYMTRGEFEKAYSIARTLLALYDDGPNFPPDGVRLRLLAAIACRELNHFDEMNQFYRQVVELVEPHGFVNQLIGYTIGPSSPLEMALQDYPDFLDKLRSYSEVHYHNLVKIHNHFTGNHRATNLTVREFFLARQLKMGKTYKEIARYLDVSTGYLHNLVVMLYEKLDVHSRKELEPLVW